MLYSIESLDPANIVDTMNKPIVVHASDLEYYFCKYNRLDSVAYRLFKEYLAASFLPEWGFKYAAIQIIQVRDDDIPLGLGIPRAHFSKPCFGLKAVPRATELDKHNTNLLTQKKLAKGFHESFLRLCFFDVWMANEDRSHNNYNILLTRNAGLYDFIPIDHEACFNHRVLANGLAAIIF